MNGWTFLAITAASLLLPYIIIEILTSLIRLKNPERISHIRTEKIRMLSIMAGSVLIMAAILITTSSYTAARIAALLP